MVLTDLEFGAAIAIAIAATTAGLTVIMPIRWGWKAFPIVLLGGMFLILLAIYGFVMLAPISLFTGAWSVVFTVSNLVGTIAMAALAFWATLTIRRRKA